ncbi:hypothetical protein ACHAWF_008275, partial [Thalassiosira exigua]
ERLSLATPNRKSAPGQFRAVQGRGGFKSKPTSVPHKHRSRSQTMAMDQASDIEAVVPLPHEEPLSSHDERPAAGGDGRRRKVFAAVVSVALAAAVGTGVAMVMKPKEVSTVAGETGALLDNLNEEIGGGIVVDDPSASGQSSTTPEVPADGPADEADKADTTPGHEAPGQPASEVEAQGVSQGEPSDEPVNEIANEAVNVNEPDVEIVSPGSELAHGPVMNSVAEPADDPENELASDSENLGVLPVDLDELFVLQTPMEIIIDDEDPEDVTYDVGLEHKPSKFDWASTNVHETVGEKVPVDSQETVVLTEYTGPITDFILTDLSRISVSTGSLCPQSNQGLWKMDLFLDKYPWEYSWEMRNKRGAVVAAGPPPKRNYARETRYIGQICLPAGQYTLTAQDANADGICCTFGQGKMTVKANGKVVAQTGSGGFSKRQWSFDIAPQGGSPSTPKPTPTPQPTPKPTRKPSKVPGLGQNNLKCITVKIKTDSWAKETGYTMREINSNSPILLSRPVGDLKNNEIYEDTECVDVSTGPKEYRLKVLDSFQGLQEGGWFAVEVDGVEVMYDAVFEPPFKSYRIKVGYEAPMSADDRAWLDGHNEKRREYFASRNIPHKPLVWSPKLAKSADIWADKIIANNCKIIREQGITAGENMSARTTSGPGDEGWEKILKRWVDNKKNAGYPNNQSMTQVYWLGTRQVGCVTKWGPRPPNPNGRCYVSICRYARAGNCAMGQYDNWEDAVVDTRSKCGPTCAEEVGTEEVCY